MSEGKKKVYYYQRRQNLQWRTIRNKLWREDPTKDRRIQTDKMYVGTYCLRSSLCYDMHRRNERKRYFKKWLMWFNEAWEKYRTSWARRCLSDVSDICEASSFGDDRVVCLTGTVINHAGERMTTWQNNISYLHMRVCVCWGWWWYGNRLMESKHSGGRWQENEDVKIEKWIKMWVWCDIFSSPTTSYQQVWESLEEDHDWDFHFWEEIMIRSLFKIT